jgi:hypothetical protein
MLLFVVVCMEGNLLVGGHGVARRRGFVCLYMYHRCKY